jgi:predicted NUDIX family phosphoesterase
MEDRTREVKIILDNDEIVTEFDQGDMSEDEFYEAVIYYVMCNIQVEVI